MAKAKEQFLDKGLLDFFQYIFFQKKLFRGIAKCYVTRKNRLEKFCIQDKKIEDIRIVYEEYSIDKIIKNSYQNFLKVRNRVLNKRQMSTKLIKVHTDLFNYFPIQYSFE